MDLKLIYESPQSLETKRKKEEKERKKIESPIESEGARAKARAGKIKSESNKEID